MKWLAYPLVLLLLSAQVDDAWAVAPPEDADDECLLANDEYLPAQGQPRKEEPASSQGPIFLGLQTFTADFPPVRFGVLSEWNQTTPFTPPPLYVFMSLQI